MLFKFVGLSCRFENCLFLLDFCRDTFAASFCLVWYLPNSVENSSEDFYFSPLTGTVCFMHLIVALDSLQTSYCCSAQVFASGAVYLLEIICCN